MKFCLLLTSIILIGCRRQTITLPTYSLEEIYEISVNAERQSAYAVETTERLHTLILNNKNEIESLARIVYEVSPARLEENEIQLSLLIEAYRELYATLAAIRVLPQIQYAPQRPVRPQGFSLSQSSTQLLGGDEFALYSRGLNSFRGGFFEETLQLMDALLEQYPDGKLHADAHFHAGLSLVELKRYEEALRRFHSSERANESRKQAASLYHSARIYQTLKENDKALEIVETLLHRFPASSYRPRALELKNSLLGPTP